MATHIIAFAATGGYEEGPNLEVFRFMVNDQYDCEEIRQRFNFTADQKDRIEEWLRRDPDPGDTLLLKNHNGNEIGLCFCRVRPVLYRIAEKTEVTSYLEEVREPANKKDPKVKKKKGK